MKKLFLLAALFATFAGHAQVRFGVRSNNLSKGINFKEISADSLLRLPQIKLPLLAKDSGSLAYVGGIAWIWTGSEWDTLTGGPGGGIDTVVADQVTIVGNGKGDALTAVGIEAKFNTIAALRAVPTTLSANTFVQTNGFYSPNDGGGSRYLILSSAPSGLPVDSISVIQLTGGRYARIVHSGTLLCRQFGMKGDNTTNDYPGWKKIVDYARVDRNVAYILGTNGDTYRMRMISAYNDDAFTIVNFSGITFDGNGAKIVYDNNATQSYVYHTIGGVKGIYRAKQSHVSSGGSVPNKTLYWGEYNWQLVQDNVVTSGAYPTWSASGVQYYGAHHFAVIGTETQTYSGNPSIPTISGVTFRNWDITCEEPDDISRIIGYWNIREKCFFLQDGIDNISVINIKAHNILSEIVYGNGILNVQRISVVNSELYNGSNGISSAGHLTVESNTIHDIAANAYESTPLTFKQTIRNNTIYNCENGITVGGAGDDINPFGDAIVESNRIYNCTNYGVFLTRRLRGAKVFYNTIYDVQYGVGIVASSTSYADAVSDIQVSNNTIGAYHYNGGYGIILSSDGATDTMRTSNILISNNTFDKIEAAYIEGLNNSLGITIFLFGDKFKNITIRDNTDLFPLSVPFLARHSTAAGVNINTINNSKAGWSESNASRSNLLQVGGTVNTGGLFQAQSPITFNSFGGTPEISLNAYSAATDQKLWSIKPGNDGTLNFGMMNDAGAISNFMTVGRSGSTYANVIFPIGATLAGAYFQTDGLGGSTNLSDIGYGSTRGFRVGANSGFDGPAFMLFGGEYPGLTGQAYLDFGSTARNISGRKFVIRSATTGMAYDVMSLNDAGLLKLNGLAGNGTGVVGVNNDGEFFWTAGSAGGSGTVTNFTITGLPGGMGANVTNQFTTPGLSLSLTTGNGVLRASGGNFTAGLIDTTDIANFAAKVRSLITDTLKAGFGLLFNGKIIEVDPSILSNYGAQKTLPDANYTVLATDRYLLLGTPTTQRTIYLPDPTTTSLREIYIDCGSANTGDWVLNGAFVQTATVSSSLVFANNFSNSGLASGATYHLMIFTNSVGVKQWRQVP